MEIPPCLYPQTIIIYKIPIMHCHDYVYMRPNVEFGPVETVFVRTDRFLSIWNDSPYFDTPHGKRGIPYAKTPENWHHDEKLLKGKVAEGFSHGILNPFSIAVVAALADKKLNLQDGITRTLWLLTHEVKAFPLGCPFHLVDELKSLAGIELE